MQGSPQKTSAREDKQKQDNFSFKFQSEISHQLSSSSPMNMLTDAFVPSTAKNSKHPAHFGI